MTDSGIIRRGLRNSPLSNTQADRVSAPSARSVWDSAVWELCRCGDQIASSDVDILALVAVSERSIRSNDLSISFYTGDQLLSASKTLYGTHLLRDGRVLWERDGNLTAILNQLEEADPRELLTRVRELSVVLDVEPSVLSAQMDGLCQLARYLLRTGIYAKAMEMGTPCFSVRELADRFNDPDLEHLLASDPKVVRPASQQQFEQLISRLNTLLGPLPTNRWGSIEALVVENWDKDEILANCRHSSNLLWRITV